MMMLLSGIEIVGIRKIRTEIDWVRLKWIVKEVIISIKILHYVFLILNFKLLPLI